MKSIYYLEGLKRVKAIPSEDNLEYTNLDYPFEYIAIKTNDNKFKVLYTIKGMRAKDVSDIGLEINPNDDSRVLFNTIEKPNDMSTRKFLYTLIDSKRNYKRK